jgi:hypothetical protein
MTFARQLRTISYFFTLRVRIVVQCPRDDSKIDIFAIAEIAFEKLFKIVLKLFIGLAVINNLIEAIMA